MWIIVEIFDGDYGCENSNNISGELMVSVYLENDLGERRTERVADIWLRKNNLDVGSVWPDYSDTMFETDELLIKKAQFSDWKAIYENLWSHEDSARYMLWNITKSEQEAIDRMKRTLEFQKYHKYSLFVYEKSSGVAIGFAGMKEIKEGIYEDTGVALGPKYIGRGYGTQVLQALVMEAAANGATQFITSCRTKNIASHNLQMKCGFVFSHFEDRVDKRNGESYVLEFNKKDLK